MPASSGRSGGGNQEIEALKTRVDTLENEVAELRGLLAELRAELGG
jgi:uncharacterized protein YceH (UPF0502 family)